MNTGNSGNGSHTRLTQQWTEWLKDHLTEGAQKSAANMTSAAWLKTIQQLKTSMGQLYDELGDSLGERSADPKQIKALEGRLAELERKVAELTKEN